MNEPEEDPAPPRTTRLRPRTLGRSVPLPPLIPTVVIVSVVLGMVIGFGLASKPGPPSGLSASESSSLPAAASHPGETPAATPFEFPPAGGLTLSQALAALNGAAVGTDSPTGLISARIARFGDVASGALPADRWVWAFVVRASLDAGLCGGIRPSPAPCASSATTELAIFDYRTGEFLEDRLPAYP